MGVMTLGAGTGTDGTMDIFSAKFIFFMAFQAQFFLAVCYLQQGRPGTTMGLVTAQTVSFCHRGMDNFSLWQGIMTVGTQICSFGHQGKGFPTALTGMLGNLPLVTFETFTLGHRSMRTGYTGKILVAVGSNT